jgi:thioester reductase-like protein
MIDLAARAPVPGGARLLFVSSISVLFSTCLPANTWHMPNPSFADHPEDSLAPEAPLPDPRTSAGLGYAESKWVAETLVLGARKAGVRGGTARVGQVCGDTQHGGWNRQEWVGAIARCGQLVGALPERPGDVRASHLYARVRS